MKCDDCDNEATHSVLDRVEVPSDNSAIKDFEYGAVRSGCDLHKKVAMMKYLDGTVRQV